MARDAGCDLATLGFGGVGGKLSLQTSPSHSSEACLQLALAALPGHAVRHLIEQECGTGNAWEWGLFQGGHGEVSC